MSEYVNKLSGFGCIGYPLKQSGSGTIGITAQVFPDAVTEICLKNKIAHIFTKAIIYLLFFFFFTHVYFEGKLSQKDCFTCLQ